MVGGGWSSYAELQCHHHGHEHRLFRCNYILVGMPHLGERKTPSLCHVSVKNSMSGSLTMIKSCIKADLLDRDREY